jgi:hypothetical protein
MDPDPDLDLDPAIFVIDFRDVNKKKILLKKFLFAYYFLKVHLHRFSKIKSKKSHETVISRFFILFLLDDRRPQTNGPRSGSRRPKTIWIRRIRICNTDFHTFYILIRLMYTVG